MERIYRKDGKVGSESESWDRKVIVPKDPDLSKYFKLLFDLYKHLKNPLNSILRVWCTLLIHKGNIVFGALKCTHRRTADLFTFSESKTKVIYKISTYVKCCANLGVLVRKKRKTKMSTFRK